MTEPWWGLRLQQGCALKSLRRSHPRSQWLSGRKVLAVGLGKSLSRGARQKVLAVGLGKSLSRGARQKVLAGRIGKNGQCAHPDRGFAIFQSRSQSLRYPCPAERETRDSGIQCCRSKFHWPKGEYPQLNRKF